MYAETITGDIKSAKLTQRPPRLRLGVESSGFASNAAGKHSDSNLFYGRRDLKYVCLSSCDCPSELLTVLGMHTLLSCSRQKGTCGDIVVHIFKVTIDG